MLEHPVGPLTCADAHWLFSILNKEFVNELVRRGYDPETINFSVALTKRK